MIAASHFFLIHFYKANILIYLHSTFVYRCLWWETVLLPHQPLAPIIPNSKYLLKYDQSVTRVHNKN